MRHLEHGKSSRPSFEWPRLVQAAPEIMTGMTESANAIDMGSGRIVRPATIADIPQLRASIVEAVDDSPFYNAHFKAHEKARLNERFLLSLMAADPWYVTLMVYRGEIAGFVILTPELGVLWAAWIYVAPRFRRTAIALYAIKSLIGHFDNGCFHKVLSLVAPANERYVAVLKRLGYIEIALLREHMFGEDYLLLEVPFNKTSSGYAPPVNFGRMNLLKFRLKSMLGRRQTYPR